MALSRNIVVNIMVSYHNNMRANLWFFCFCIAHRRAVLRAARHGATLDNVTAACHLIISMLIN